MFPGLCGDAPAAVHRVLLGTLPQLNTERRLMRQLQSVMPWYQTRRRVKEMASEFVELDLASIDAETMLRYAHVFYVRRQICRDSMEKQLSMLDSGKAPKSAEQAIVSCLADLNSKISTRLEEELTLLSETKKKTTYYSTLFPLTSEELAEADKNESLDALKKPLELDSESPLEPCDYLAMMRLCEESAGGIIDLEAKCKPFLPAPHILGSVRKFALNIIGKDDVRPELDKKEQKLLSRMLLPDYTKIGCVEKYRPVDVTAVYRFYGERLPKAGDSFTRSLWGHFFRKFSSHPSFLVSISRNWATSTGLVTQSSRPLLPIDLATGAWEQQKLFPALKFRAQYLYTSADHARQAWKVDHFIPMMRLFPLTGQLITEDLAASILVEGYWAKLHLEPSDSVHEESFWKGVREFIKEMSGLREKNLDALTARLVDAFPCAVPLESTKKAVVDDAEDATVATEGSKKVKQDDVPSKAEAV
jgi:hypothetical protein